MQAIGPSHHSLVLVYMPYIRPQAGCNTVTCKDLSLEAWTVSQRQAQAAGPKWSKDCKLQRLLPILWYLELNYFYVVRIYIQFHFFIPFSDPYNARSSIHTYYIMHHCHMHTLCSLHPLIFVQDPCPNVYSPDGEEQCTSKLQMYMHTVQIKDMYYKLHDFRGTHASVVHLRMWIVIQ